MCNIDGIFLGNCKLLSYFNQCTPLTPFVVTTSVPLDPLRGNYRMFKMQYVICVSACRSPFGVEKGGVIQSNQMSSSSHVDSTHTPSHGRLYGDTSWCSTTSSNTEYLQINLGKIVTLTGIATQGDRTMDKWVETYTFNYSMDGNLWTTYRGGLDSAKVV